MSWVLCRGGLSCPLLHDGRQRSMALESSKSSLKDRAHLAPSHLHFSPLPMPMPMPMLALPLQHSNTLPGSGGTPWRVHHTPIETRSNPRPTGVPSESKVDQVFSALSSTYHSHWILATLTSCCRALRAARRPPLACENPSVRTVLGWRSGVPWYPPPRIPRQCTSSAILVVQLIIDQGCAWATDQEYT
jgi:hypothetical protein